MTEINFNPGDYVVVGLAKREIEGVVLDSPDKGIVLVKLNSGYNIGIAKENILHFRVLKKFQGKNNFPEVKKSKEKQSIGLIMTGGTIASRLDTRTGAASPITDIKEFAKFYPKIFERVNIKKLEIPFMKDSSSMDYKDWIKIAECAYEMLLDEEIKGIIITHGTDTLHYTSSALSFFLKDLNKPIVFSYSQRSGDRPSSDADLNLDCAVEFALSDCAEIVLIGHSSTNDDFCYALPANKTRKLHSSRRDAFKSVNSSPIAKVWRDKVEFLKGRRPRNKDVPKINSVFNDKIVFLKFYPGQSPEILDYYKDLGIKGIVLETLGLGQIATSDSKNSWIPTIKKIIKSGVFVCAVSQTINGRVNPKVYSAGRELDNAGVVFLDDILGETAFVKLGWVLGQKGIKSIDKIKEKMLENVSGEFNELIGE